MNGTTLIVGVSSMLCGGCACVTPSVVVSFNEVYVQVAYCFHYVVSIVCVTCVVRVVCVT